jgi:hypothetical protein
MGYGVRDLVFRSDVKDRSRLEEFLARSPRYATLLMRRAAADLESYNGFWTAALEAGLEIKALASLEGGVTRLYGEEPEALDALGHEMVRRVRYRPGETGMFQIVGDERVVDSYWRAFSKVGNARPVASDRRQRLYATKAAAEPSKSEVVVERAKLEDLKVVYAFAGDYTVEQWGFDPRRLMPEGHEAACRAAIAEGRQLIGRERGRPIFVAELSAADGESFILEKVHVPRPFRVRKKMVASALANAAAIACEGGREALLFADAGDAQTTASAELAGFAVARNYRLIVMRR